MNVLFEKLDKRLEKPLEVRARWGMMLMVIPLLLTFTMPLWTIHMVAPQYPKGLDLYIYAHKVDGGNKGHDIKEINTLNHYIGMAKIDRAQLADLDWIPFAIGILIILMLRVAFIGNVRALIDMTVLALYFGAFSMGRFYYKLYSIGHNLAPEAPVKVEPFTPVVFGTRQIANFTVSSYPRGGSFMMALVVGCLLALTLWHLKKKPT